MAETHVFEDGQVNQAGRSHPVAMGVRCAIANDIKAKFTFRALDSTVRFSSFGFESANLRLGIHNRPGRYFLESAIEDFNRLSHLEHPDHVAIITIAVIAERDAKWEPLVDAVFVDFADV